MATKQVHVLCTAFRDGFQSVYGARVLTKDFMPAVAAARAAGITHMECGGGARFQALFFYCNENAFDMMDTFRATAGPDADLQTLARGISVVALESQPRDMIKLHAETFKKHGVTTIRNFDALNDVGNLIYSGQCIKDAGLKHEVVVSCMELPPGSFGAHDPEFYEMTLRKILDAGIPYDSVCFKDASGTLVPSKVYETIRRARKMLPEGTRISFHSHDTAGTCTIAYKAAIEGGADQVDLSMAPCSGGTCQPDIVTMWHALRGTDYELDVDIDKVREAEEVFKECMKDYFVPPEALAVEPMIPWAPMPGGALTANTQMMRDNDIMHKYQACIAAMGEVVRRGGFGTSVTPVSQFYFQQAFNNVMFGDWKKIADGYGKMILGYFGKTPVAPDPELVKIAAEQLKLPPTTENPMDVDDRNPKKGIPAVTKTLSAAGLPVTDDNIFIVGACGEKGITFLKGEAKINGIRKVEVAKKAPAAAAVAEVKPVGPASYNVNLDGRLYSVRIDGTKAVVDGKAYAFDVKEGELAPAGETPKPAVAATATPLSSPMPGVVFRVNKESGSVVKAGEPVLTLEAMKMEIEVAASADGVITIHVKKGDQVATGDIVASIA